MLRQAPAMGQIPAMMKAWALFAPDDLRPVTKPVPRPDLAEALVKVEAVAICGTDLEILHRGLPAMVDGKPPFDCQHVIGHEYAGTTHRFGLDELPRALETAEKRLGDAIMVVVKP